MGRIGRPRGVDGDFAVIALTDFPDRFLEMSSVFVAESGSWTEFEIERSELVGGRPVMKLRSIDSPEAAAKLADRELAVTRDQLVPLDKDQFYVFELIGCNVYDADSGAQIGTIADVQRYPANDVYVIGDADGHRWICPAVAEFVRSVDVAAQKIVIRSAGLLAGENGAG